MRFLTQPVLSFVVCVSLGLACNSDKGSATASGGASASAEVSAKAALSVSPTFGGSVLMVGEHPVELAIAENGFVQGLVYDAQGKAIASADPQLSVALRTKGGRQPKASLVWNGPHGRLEGRAQLEAGLSAEPIEVSLDLSGQHASAMLSDYAILPFARFGGSVLAAGPYAVEVLAKGDVVSAYVLDASGQAQGGADFSLKLQFGAGGEHALELQWDAARACYAASFAGDLSAQPLRLSLTAFGKAYAGAAASLKAVAAARMDARAQLNASARAQLDVPEPNVEAALGAGAKAAADAKAQLNAGVKAGAKAAGAAQAKASASVKAPSVKAPSVQVQKSASASASSKTSGAKVKASAGVKAGVHLGF
jgi:hypothetical protein